MAEGNGQPVAGKVSDRSTRALGAEARELCAARGNFVGLGRVWGDPGKPIAGRAGERMRAELLGEPTSSDGGSDDGQKEVGGRKAGEGLGLAAVAWVGKCWVGPTVDHPSPL